jgi:hypothetical protein
MARRKTLSFKSPDQMKTIFLIFVVALFLSPGVRNITSATLHTVADIIAPQN